MLVPVRTAAPASTPVTLAQAKLHCRVDHDNEDTLITALIAAATDHLDGFTGILGRALITQTWRQDFGGFSSALRLPLRPVASISSVTYYDGGNAQQTLSPSVYGLFTDERGAHVALKPDQVWPGTFSRSDAVSVTFIAGVADASVPQPIKQAMLLMIGHWYAGREAVAAGDMRSVPMAVDALLQPYRTIGV